MLSWFRVCSKRQRGASSVEQAEESVSRFREFLEGLRTEATRVNYAWGIKYVLKDPDVFRATLRQDLLEDFLDREAYRDLMPRELRFCAGVGDQINKLGDEKGWTFKYFAEKATELGI
jgi:hypothetical protein